MYFDLANILVFAVVGGGFVIVNLLISRLLRPKSGTEPNKLAIYECGEPTVGQAWIRFDIRFYTVALMFVVFDVEVALLFPWGAVFRVVLRRGGLWIVLPNGSEEPLSPLTDGSFRLGEDRKVMDLVLGVVQLVG